MKNEKEQHLNFASDEEVCRPRVVLYHFLGVRNRQE